MWLGLWFWHCNELETITLSLSLPRTSALSFQKRMLPPSSGFGLGA